MELCLNPELIKKWTKIKRKEAKEAKKADQPTNPSEMLENKFLRNLIEEFLEVHLWNYAHYSVISRYGFYLTPMKLPCRFLIWRSYYPVKMIVKNLYWTSHSVGRSMILLSYIVRDLWNFWLTCWASFLLDGMQLLILYWQHLYKDCTLTLLIYTHIPLTSIGT